MAASTGRVIIYVAAMDALLHSPTGNVGRALVKKGAEWRLVAKSLAPHGRGIHEGAKLADSIHVESTPKRGATGLTVRGYVSAKHGLVVAKGSLPHTIRPRNKTVLKFDVGGTTVFAREVHHPGTKPNNFMVDALHAVVH